MSKPRFAPNAGHFYSNIVQPMKIDVQFTVSSTDTGGAGITSLKSNGFVNHVFMNTSATPASGSPNPAAGYALIQLKNNYNKYLTGKIQVQSPLTGGELAINGTNLTVGVAYQITTLGTSTLADWQLCGLPVGLTPTVGQSFIATHTGDGPGTGTGKVKAIGVSGIVSAEIIGNPTLEIANSNISQNGGAWVLVQFLGATSSSVTTLIPTAPAAGSVVMMSLEFDQSSVTVDGL